LHGSEAGFDIAQAFSTGKLSEYHTKELVKTRKVSYMPVATVTMNAGIELTFGQEIKQLSEDGSTRVHWSVLSALAA
jgi:hypothetical protein